MLKPAVMLIALFVLTLSSAFAEECPVINGTFGRELYENGKHLGRLRIILRTRVVNGKFSYERKNDGYFQLANGVPREFKFSDGPRGSISMSCAKGSLIFVNWEEGIEGTTTQKVRPDGPSRLVVEADEAHLAGVFELE